MAFFLSWIDKAADWISTVLIVSLVGTQTRAKMKQFQVPLVRCSFLSVALIFCGNFFACSQTGTQEFRVLFADSLDRDAMVHVVVFLDPECPISQKYTATLRAMAGKYSRHGVAFYGSMSVRGINGDEIREFEQYYRPGIKCYADAELRVASSLTASVTPEAFVLDQDMQVLYSGAIDDWYYDLGKARRNPNRHFLSDAINAVLAGEKPRVARTEAVGCQISFTPLSR